MGQIRAEQWGAEGSEGQNGSNSPIRAEQWANSPIRAEQWGVKGVGGAKMGQIFQFVLNNGGAKGSEGPKCVKFSNSC